MTPRLLNLLILVGYAGTIAVGTRSVAEETTAPAFRQEKAAASRELLFVTGDRPSRLAIQIEIDGVPIHDVWEATFGRMFQFFDRDATGSLDEVEVLRLPSPFALRQVLWGRFALDSGVNPPHQLDTDASGSVSREELSAHYRRSGLGEILIGVGRVSITEALNEAFINSIDTNRDGLADESEWQSAAEMIAQRDSNDDEQIGPGELVARSAYPGAVGSVFLRSSVREEEPNPAIASLPFLLLPKDARASSSIADLLAAFRMPNRRIDPDQIAAILASPSKSFWTIQATASAEGTRIQFPIKELSVPSNKQRIHSAGPVRFVLRCDQGKLSTQAIAARKQFEALFAEFDTNSDGILHQQELLAPRARALGQLAKSADRDNDESVSRSEFSNWLDLMDHIANGQFLLTIIDHGCGLFEVIDDDHDGALSRRELHAAADRLKTAGCFREGRFDQKELPHHLLAVVSHGHPQSPLGRPDRRGPKWFQAMDRNGDGDLSRREFTGPAEAFHKLDLNRDGYLDPVEAESFKKN